MPGVFLIDGLSALGLNSCCLLAGGPELPSVVTARAEKKAATGSAPPAAPVTGAVGSEALLAFVPGRWLVGFGVCGGACR